MASTEVGSIHYDLNLETKGFDSAIKSVTSSLKQVGANMEQIGRDLSLRVTAPIVSALGLATKSAIDYESAFAGVRKTVDASEAEFTQLSNNIRDIAKQSPTSAVELSKIGEIAGQLGVRGVDNLTVFIDTISKLGVTTNLAGEQGATAFARIANIMQEPLSNVDRMGSAVVDLGNKFATTESEIAEFANRIAGAGKIAGLTTSDILAIGTAMSSVGIEAEAGGTAVQKVLIQMTQSASGLSGEIMDNTAEIAKNGSKLEDLKNKLSLAKMQMKEYGDNVKESTKASKQMQIDKYTAEIAQLETELGGLVATNGSVVASTESFASVLGVTNEQFSQMFKENPADVFTQFVNKLGEQGDKAFGILEDLDLQDQRLIRSFLSLANAGDLLNRTLDVSTNAWEENNALNAEAEKRFATTESQLQIFNNNMKDLGITVGGMFLPAINDLVKALTPMIQGFAKFAEQHPGLMKVVAVIGLLVASIGPLVLLVGSVITAFSSFSALVPIITAVGPAIGAVFTFILANPIVLLIAGIIALVVIIVKNWDVIKAKTLELASAIGQFFGGIKDAIMGAVNTFVDFVKGKFEEFKNTLIAVGKAVWEFIQAVASPFVWLHENIVEPIMLLISVVILRIFYEIFMFIKDILTQAIDFINQKFIQPFMDGLNKLKEFISSVWNSIKNNVINPIVSSIVSYVIGRWNELSNKVKQAWELIKTYIINPINDAKNSATNSVSNLYNSITGKLSELASRLKSIGSSILSALVKPFEDAKKKIEETAEKIRKLADKINPFHKESPSLVENVQKGLGIIAKEYEQLTDIRMPTANSLFGFDGATDIFGGATVQKQNVYVNVDKMGDKMDLDAVGRELGFKASLVPGLA